jgi:hypothetical protein
MLGALFGSIGLGYFIFGKKQQAMVPLLCGIALMLLSYFISDSLPLIGVGCAIAAVPCFLRI